MQLARYDDKLVVMSRGLFYREAMVEPEAGAPRVVVAMAAAGARAARVGAKEAETRVAAVAKAIAANRGVKGRTMEAAPGRKAASQRHRVVRVPLTHLLCLVF